MCGIAGIVGLQGIAGPERCATRMTDALAHRGPDAEGIWRDGDEVILGHRRLSIIDLSAEANQPFHSADGRYVIAYNGELYNFRALRTELENAPGGARPFRTDSDTEVVLAAYARWGPACLERFNGMFAFALWDREKKELFIARDRLGIKPVYFFHREGRLIFASEVRALLATDLVPRKVDQAALSDYIRYQFVHAPATMVQDVRMVMPGHWLRYKAGAIEEHCWWDPVSSADRDAAELSIEDVRTGIRDRLTRAVERRLVSDVPFGAFLSGGIDSSAIVGLMAEVSSDPVHTFSIGFDEAEFNEEHYARMVASKFRTVHTSVCLSPDVLLGALPDILASMDHPSGDGPNIYMVSRATKQAGITMALSGLGSDELFAGYGGIFARLMKYRPYGLFAAMPPFFRRAGVAVVSRLKYPKEYHTLAHAMLLGSVDVDRTYPKLRQVSPEPGLRSLMTGRSLAPDEQVRIAHELLRVRKGSDLPVLSQISLMEISTYMQNQLLRDTDQMSMAHALEVRVPFLDHELVEFVTGVSDAHKTPHTPKELLTTALGDLLPPEIIHRPKMGFTLPWSEWMRKELQTFCEERILRLGQRTAFDGGVLNDLWKNFLRDPRQVHWARLWYLVVLEDWLERHGVEA